MNRNIMDGFSFAGSRGLLAPPELHFHTGLVRGYLLPEEVSDDIKE
jgi:hypothetical protein